ncbi:MAG: NUDIX domain-containing protein [Candidatus Moranbacteria bacterium]|nr:NUDIX domain-containing protein [Candidatus Moranbacteria bacterium]
MKKYNFQFCPKIVVFSNDLKSVLLCRRKDEKDHNGIFSFIGGKMETTDESIVAGLAREKDEEVGKDFRIDLYAKYSANLFFIKKDGSKMILPHYYAIHKSGEIKLNEEYSEFRWVMNNELKNFEPKISNIPESVGDMRLLMGLRDKNNFVEI